MPAASIYRPSAGGASARRVVALKYEMLQAGEKSSVSTRGRQQLAAVLQTPPQGRAAQDLSSDLDVHGPRVPDELPLKFAQDLVSRYAGAFQKTVGGAFLQASAEQPLSASYSSRSGGIVGILTQMLEFEAELQESQKSGVTSVADHEALAAAQTKRISAAKEKLDEVESEASATQKGVSDAEEDLALTRNQRTAGIKFLQSLQTQCNVLDTEFERRSKTRAAEVAAVSEAMSILAEDDNREHWAKTVTLVQVQHRLVVSVQAARVRKAMTSADLEGRVRRVRPDDRPQEVGPHRRRRAEAP